jgi:GNAT superfamily N-acetyltransferase
MEIQIVSLNEDNLEKAKEMSLKTFDTIETDNDYAPMWFDASVYPEKYTKEYNSIKVNWVQYWLAIGVDGKVLGSVGLYATKDDENEALWLGWFGVLPEMRNKGIGKKLLEFAIEKTKFFKKKFLRLYTSTSPLETMAQIVYEKNGFREVKRIDEPGKRYTTIYRELQL